MLDVKVHCILDTLTQEPLHQTPLQQLPPPSSSPPLSRPQDPSPNTTTTAWPKEQENTISGGSRTNRPLNFGVGIRDPSKTSVEDDNPNNPTSVREEFRRKVHGTVDISCKTGIPVSTLPTPPSLQAPGYKATAAVQKPGPVSVSATALKTPGGGGGGQTLVTTKPSAVFAGTLNDVVDNGLVAGGGHVMSCDQDDDAVFSPSSTDDEHMKHIEKVCAQGEEVYMYRCMSCSVSSRISFGGGGGGGG